METVKNAAETLPNPPAVRDRHDAVSDDGSNGRGSGAVAVSEGAAIIQMIERAARDPSVDLDKMERLYAMKERMEASHSKQAFLAAFAELQRVLPAVAKKGKGHGDKTYARFEDVIETAKPHLADYGFSLSFRLEHSEKTIKVTGVLGHASGHSESTDIVLPADTSGSKNVVQAWGSSVSYGKRYVAMTLLGIATQDDDDGKAAGDLAEPAKHTVADLQALIDQGKNAKETTSWLCNHYSVEDLSDLTQKQLAEAISGLRARIKNQKVRKS